MPRRTARGRDCACRASWSGRKGRGGWMAGPILGATSGNVADVAMLGTEVRRRRVASGPTPQAVARGGCTRWRGTYGSGARTGTRTRPIAGTNVAICGHPQAVARGRGAAGRGASTAPPTVGAPTATTATRRIATTSSVFGPPGLLGNPVPLYLFTLWGAGAQPLRAIFFPAEQKGQAC